MRETLAELATGFLIFAVAGMITTAVYVLIQNQLARSAARRNRPPDPNNPNRDEAASCGLGCLVYAAALIVTVTGLSSFLVRLAYGLSGVDMQAKVPGRQGMDHGGVHMMDGANIGAVLGIAFTIFFFITVANRVWGKKDTPRTVWGKKDKRRS